MKCPHGIELNAYCVGCDDDGWNAATKSMAIEVAGRPKTVFDEWCDTPEGREWLDGWCADPGREPWEDWQLFIAVQFIEWAARFREAA